MRRAEHARCKRGEGGEIHRCLDAVACELVSQVCGGETVETIVMVSAAQSQFGRAL